MVAAVTVADYPILVLGPALAKQLHVSTFWSGWFIAALGAGTVLGSFRRSKHQPTMRLAATALAALALFMLLLVHAPTMWIGAIAALGGWSCLIANSVTRSALVEHAGPEKTAVVMAIWAIGPQWTGLILATPALIPFLVIILEPRVGFWITNPRGRQRKALAGNPGASPGMPSGA
jgi:predicted MFS family arabinose efflux permease